MPEAKEMPQKSVTVGKIEPIERLEELPSRILDSLLEGLTTTPQDFAIMGMGFLLGYEGIDLMAMLLKPIDEIIGKVAKIAKTIAEWNPLDIKLPTDNISIGSDIKSVLYLGSLGTLGDMPTAQLLGTIKGKIVTAKTSSDPAEKAKVPQLVVEAVLAEQKAKILMGCVGALVAYSLTRPGTLQAIGGVVGSALEGLGQAVPL